MKFRITKCNSRYITHDTAKIITSYYIYYLGKTLFRKSKWKQFRVDQGWPGDYCPTPVYFNTIKDAREYVKKLKIVYGEE